MNERLKKLRKALDLTQQEFANQIGSSQNLITNYESGRRNPSSSAINNICKTFNVNEEWLRTGEGDMFKPESHDELDEILRKYHLPGFLRGLFLRYDKLPPEARALFETMIQEWAAEIVGEISTPAPVPAPAKDDDPVDLERIRLHQMLDEQLDEEERRKEARSAS